MPEIPKMDFVTDAALWTPLQPDSRATVTTQRAHHRYCRQRSFAPALRSNKPNENSNKFPPASPKHIPTPTKAWSMHGMPLKVPLSSVTPALLSLVLFGAVGFVLLIACANVSNLFLSRGWSRRREFAIRSAIGATRGALLRQQLVESTIVALFGGVCALLVSAVDHARLCANLLPPETPRLESISVDSGVAHLHPRRRASRRAHRRSRSRAPQRPRRRQHHHQRKRRVRQPQPQLPSSISRRRRSRTRSHTRHRRQPRRAKLFPHAAHQHRLPHRPPRHDAHRISLLPLRKRPEQSLHFTDQILDRRSLASRCRVRFRRPRLSDG